MTRKLTQLVDECKEHDAAHQKYILRQNAAKREIEAKEAMFGKHAQQSAIATGVCHTMMLQI